MARATAIARWWVFGTGPIILLLGLLFWAGHADQLEALHGVLAITLVLALYSLAVIGAVVGAPARTWASAFVWVVLVPGLGVGQLVIYDHVSDPIVVNLVRSLHLLFGLAAIGTAYWLSEAIRGRVAFAGCAAGRPRGSGTPGCVTCGRRSSRWSWPRDPEGAPRPLS